jgi:hypothetical protein
MRKTPLHRMVDLEDCIGYSQNNLEMNFAGWIKKNHLETQPQVVWNWRKSNGMRKLNT